MPQLDQMSFMSQIVWFILTFYSLYSLILIYILPPIFRTLKYRSYKFNLLINQINFLNSSLKDGNKIYTNLLQNFVVNNNKIFKAYTNDYFLTLENNQKNNYTKLNMNTKNILSKIILRKITL
jgi:Plant ATP synthase F0